MGWILSCIDRLRMMSEPSPLDSTPAVLGEEAFPVAMMPLGTGEFWAGPAGGGGEVALGESRFLSIWRIRMEDVSNVSCPVRDVVVVLE